MEESKIVPESPKSVPEKPKNLPKVPKENQNREPKEESIVKCDFCPYGPENIETIKYHRALMHNACPDCPKVFMELYALKNHQETEHLGCEFPLGKCSYCPWIGKRSEIPVHSQRHRNEYKTDKNPSKPSDVQPGIIPLVKCQKCDFVAVPSELLVHKRENHDQK